MKGVNKVILIGSVGEDPVTKYMPNGSAVVNLSLATSESWKDKNSGEKVDRVEWHRIVFFNKLAEVVGKYVKKGSKLYIEGRLQTRSWEQDGVKRYATEIVGSEMQMLDSKPATVTHDHSGKAIGDVPFYEAPAEVKARAVNYKIPHKAGVQAQPNFDNFDDDIPF